MQNREIVLVMGRTGMGKSIWTRSYCKNKKRIFAYDPLMELNVNYVDRRELINLHDSGLLSSDNPHAVRIGVTNEEDLEVLAALAFLHGDAHLVIEEAGILFPPGARAPSWMRDAVFIGRHRRLSLLITAQRPTSIPVDMRSQASRVVCFSQREQRDMGWLEEFYGEQSQDVPSLGVFECLDSDSAGVKRYKIDVKNDDKKPLQNSEN